MTTLARTVRRTALALVTAAAAILAATAPLGAQDRPAPQDPQEPNTRWDYLRLKYDADGDGEVSRQEYDRSDETFARLDADGDGTLTAADFERRGGRRAPMTPEQMADRMGPRMVMMAFNTGRGDLALDAARARFDELDADDSGGLDADEMAEAVQTRRRLPMTPFEMIARVVDGDDDGLLAWNEVESFLRTRDADGDGVLTPDEQNGRVPETAQQGEPAPDFTLPLLEGEDGETVTLSDYKGDKPVALIFGSYT